MKDQLFVQATIKEGLCFKFKFSMEQTWATIRIFADFRNLPVPDPKL